MGRRAELRTKMTHTSFEPEMEDTTTARTSKRTRRKWTAEAKGQVVWASLAPGANVSEIARHHEISRQHLYLWRKAALVGELALPVDQDAMKALAVVAAEPKHRLKSSSRAPVIEIDVSGYVVRVYPGVDVELLAAILHTLKIVK